MVGRAGAVKSRWSVASEHGAVDRLLDLLMPPTCAGCGLEGELVCHDCLRHLGARLDADPRWPIGLPGDLPAGLAQLEWCAPFTGPTRRALHELKYAGNQRLATPLGRLLAERWRRAGMGGDLLVPVPVHEERLRQRGYDQAVLLAEVAAAVIGLPLAPALRRVERTAAMHELGREARSANVGSAFAIAPGAASRVAGRRVVLVDDVTTTGASLSACATVLHGAGASVVSGLTIARER
jgi:ComF family protein